jgi:hypothetical protein
MGKPGIDQEIIKQILGTGRRNDIEFLAHGQISSGESAILDICEIADTKRVLVDGLHEGADIGARIRGAEDLEDYLDESCVCCCVALYG